nr:MAG TPA: hypothetical protein [Caudoviricetes sp.]
MINLYIILGGFNSFSHLTFFFLFFPLGGVIPLFFV